MKTIIKIFLLTTLLINCNEKISSNKTENSIKNKCLLKADKKEILENILSNKTIDKYLHLEIEDRNPIKILANNYFNNKIELKYNGKDVLFIEDYDKYDDILKINLLKIDCDNDSINFTFSSKIEGADIHGIVFKNNTWNVKILSEREH